MSAKKIPTCFLYYFIILMLRRGENLKILKEQHNISIEEDIIKRDHLRFFLKNLNKFC